MPPSFEVDQNSQVPNNIDVFSPQSKNKTFDSISFLKILAENALETPNRVCIFIEMVSNLHGDVNAKPSFGPGFILNPDKYLRRKKICLDNGKLRIVIAFC